jgi:hypothetical protein
MSNIQYWTMKNGKKISVDDMDIDHLRNVLKMILRERQTKSSIGNIERRFLEDNIAYECDATEIDIY